ncbi:MAG: hypothetical protein V1792_19985 [Pseudomonadota bacterium]
MTKRFFKALRRHEIYVAAAVIAVVFVAATGVVAWMLRSSFVTPPYESLSGRDLQKVFATGYLRFREDDGTPYLKLEIHNGTLWWIKKVEFDFDGTRYALRDSDAFRPLHFGALRCVVKTVPRGKGSIEYDLPIVKAYGYPPAQVQWNRASEKVAGGPGRTNPRN